MHQQLCLHPSQSVRYRFSLQRITNCCSPDNRHLPSCPTQRHSIRLHSVVLCQFTVQQGTSYRGHIHQCALSETYLWNCHPKAFRQDGLPTFLCSGCTSSQYSKERLASEILNWLPFSEKHSANWLLICACYLSQEMSSNPWLNKDISLLAKVEKHALLLCTNEYWFSKCPSAHRELNCTSRTSDFPCVSLHTRLTEKTAD